MAGTSNAHQLGRLDTIYNKLGSSLDQENEQLRKALDKKNTDISQSTKLAMTFFEKVNNLKIPILNKCQNQQAEKVFSTKFQNI